MIAQKLRSRTAFRACLWLAQTLAARLLHLFHIIQTSYFFKLVLRKKSLERTEWRGRGEARPMYSE